MEYGVQCSVNNRHWYPLQKDHGNWYKYGTSNDLATLKRDQVTELCCFDRHALPKLKAKLRNSIGLYSYYIFYTFIHSMAGRYDDDDDDYFLSFNSNFQPSSNHTIPNTPFSSPSPIQSVPVMVHFQFETFTVNICKLTMVASDKWLNESTFFFGYRLLLITYCVSWINIIARAVSTHINATNGDFNFKITKIPKCLTFKCYFSSLVVPLHLRWIYSLIFRSHPTQIEWPDYHVLTSFVTLFCLLRSVCLCRNAI